MDTTPLDGAAPLDDAARPGGPDALPAPKPVLGLSLTGILGGALAAVSAAALGARLGLAGTLGGAAVGSVVSAIAAAAYTQSLRHTRELIRTRTLTTGRAGRVEVEQARVREIAPRPIPRGMPRRIAATAAILFVSAAVILTGLELGLGRSLDGQGSTTVGQVAERAVTGNTRPSSSPTGTTPASGSSTAPSSTDSSSDGSSSTSSTGTESSTTAPTGTSTTEPTGSATTPVAPSTTGETSSATTTTPPSQAPTTPAGTPSAEVTGSATGTSTG